MIGQFLLTVIIGITGGMVFKSLKVPTGELLGGMVFVAILNIATGWAFFPDDFRVPIQILSGTMIGSKISKDDILGIKKIVIPVIVLVLGMIGMNLFAGLTIYFLTHLDITTALFGSAPGGLSDMTLIAEELGANTTQVAALQLVRFLTIMLGLIPLFKKLADNDWKISFKKENAKKNIQWSKRNLEKVEHPKIEWKSFLVTLSFSATGGILLSVIGIPAGAMIGAMVSAILLNLFVGKTYFPGQFRPWLFKLIGTYLGVGVTRKSLISLTLIPIPVIILVFSVFLCTFAIAFLMHKLSDLPLGVCLLSSTPGGLQEITLLAEDMGVDISSVAILQTIRLFAVILILPQVIRLLSILLV